MTALRYGVEEAEDINWRCFKSPGKKEILMIERKVLYAWEMKESWKKDSFWKRQLPPSIHTLLRIRSPSIRREYSLYSLPESFLKPLSLQASHLKRSLFPRPPPDFVIIFIVVVVSFSGRLWNERKTDLLHLSPSPGACFLALSAIQSGRGHQNLPPASL
ncbi:hypothetical protein DdX_04258 [Ditylenchus destructor]|uniref:Uncharacterized protein n=1 Tax=Ditylenchus destructor TaxID=166010 RepID=A0AAD4NAT7_9BILA|nr:hypothetical protein DdX_04258 [Ditylenchus destructor]